jgi:hypothetical protein
MIPILNNDIFFDNLHYNYLFEICLIIYKTESSSKLKMNVDIFMCIHVEINHTANLARKKRLIGLIHKIININKGPKMSIIVNKYNGFPFAINIP